MRFEMGAQDYKEIQKMFQANPHLTLMEAIRILEKRGKDEQKQEASHGQQQ